jgi:glucose 1-dehydrogenase
LLEAIGARYISTQDVPLIDAAAMYVPFDLIYEATGFAPIVFEAMQALGKRRPGAGERHGRQ